MRPDRKFEFTRGLPEELEGFAAVWLFWVVNNPEYRAAAFGLVPRRLVFILQNGGVTTVLATKRAHFFDKRHPVFPGVREALHPSIVQAVATDPKGGGSWLIVAMDGGQQCLVPVKEDVVLSGRAVIRAHKEIRIAAPPDTGLVIMSDAEASASQ